MGLRNLWCALPAGLLLAACAPADGERSDVGGPCAALGDCLEGLYCSPTGTCYDPTVDGDADSDVDADVDGDGDADVDADGDVDGDADADEDCSMPDADGDGIADLHEGDGDADEDGAPNREDLDSDGDGVPDSVEAGDDNPCTAPGDADGDGDYNFLDLDSDADGLTDHEEAVLGSSPFHSDTDGDGWTDFVERAAGTRPEDPGDHPSEDVLLFVLPYNDIDGPQDRELPFETDIRIADVFFLMDTTHSMSEEIANLREGLSGIAASLVTLLDDLAMGVGRFDDFPLPPYGDILAGDRVFDLVQQMTDNETRVQAAVDRLEVHDGLDLPESDVPALWHTATGDAIGAYVTRASLDPTVPGTGRIGGAGFRHDSLPVVVLVTDAPMHNDRVGADSYDDDELGVTSPTYADAVDALNDIGARVVGIGGADAESDLVAIATDTGSVLADGTPLVYGINPDGTAEGGGDLSSQVTAGIEDLVLGTPQDVSTVQEDDPADAVDAREFVHEVRPLRGDPEAPDGYDHHDGATSAYGTFFGVIPGTTVVFNVQAFNDFVEEGESTQVFRMTIVLLGNRVTRLDERLVVIVVPAEEAEVPIY
jgi:hypothetical protein